MPAYDRLEMRRALDELGEDTVRERLAAGFYDPDVQPFVICWSEAKARARQETLASQQLKVARSARRAAWIAATAALIAAVAGVLHH